MIGVKSQDNPCCPRANAFVERCFAESEKPLPRMVS